MKNGSVNWLTILKMQRNENQDPGINKRPRSNWGRFSAKIIGAPTHDS